MSLRSIVLGSIVGLVIAVPVSAKEHRVVMNDATVQAAQAYLQEEGLLQQGADMNMKETRGDFVKKVVKLMYAKDLNVTCFEELGSNPKSQYTKLYADVNRDSDMGLTLCVALQVGIAKGRPDGAFHADAPIRTAEAATIVYKAYDLGPLDRQNLSGAPWYSQKLWDVDQRGILDPSIMNPAHELTMAEAAEMLLKLRKHQMRLQEQAAQTSVETAPVRLLGNEEPKSDIQARVLNSQEGVLPGVVRYRARGVDYVVPRRTRR